MTRHLLLLDHRLLTSIHITQQLQLPKVLFRSGLTSLIVQHLPDTCLQVLLIARFACGTCMPLLCRQL